MIFIDSGVRGVTACYHIEHCSPKPGDNYQCVMHGVIPVMCALHAELHAHEQACSPEHMC